MTKVHEETWEHDGSGDLRLVEHHAVGYVLTDVIAPFGHDFDRCGLAAQAPAMARLLLSLQWSAGDCPSCGAWGRRGDVRGIHTPSCALVAVLRAAGVLP